MVAIFVQWFANTNVELVGFFGTVWIINLKLFSFAQDIWRFETNLNGAFLIAHQSVDSSRKSFELIDSVCNFIVRWSPIFWGVDLNVNIGKTAKSWKKGKFWFTFGKLKNISAIHISWEFIPKSLLLTSCDSKTNCSKCFTWKIVDKVSIINDSFVRPTPSTWTLDTLALMPLRLTAGSASFWPGVAFILVKILQRNRTQTIEKTSAIVVLVEKAELSASKQIHATFHNIALKRRSSASRKKGGSVHTISST